MCVCDEGYGVEQGLKGKIHRRMIVGWLAQSRFVAIVSSSIERRWLRPQTQLFAFFVAPDMRYVAYCA